MLSTAPENPRFELRTERIDLGEGYAYSRYHVVDTVKDRTVDSFATWGGAWADCEARNKGRKPPSRTAEEWFAHWA